MPRNEEQTGGVTRRRFLALTATGVASTGALFGRSLAASGGVRSASARRLREFRLRAAVSELDLGPLGRRNIWTYDGQYPGPELRAGEGERFRVIVENGLPEPTTVHWHGLPVPNAMDGVPGLTQAPIEPGASFVYEFEATKPGSYMYHSHQGLQIDRGLFGALVVEERSPHVAYDREYTLVLDDLLPGAPPDMAQQAASSPRDMGRGRMGGMGGGMMGMGGMGMMGAQGIPDYLALLLNGRPPADPPTFEVRNGERLRLRLVNPSGATIYRTWIAGHRMSVSHADGRPVKPVEVDALDIGMGERYDVVVDARDPGAWEITAAPLQTSGPTTRAAGSSTATTPTTWRWGWPARCGTQVAVREVMPMPEEIEKPVLDAQRQHWEGMLESKPEMFGRDPSEPARRSAAELKAAGAQRILELGGGQGRDSLFFAAEGFQVHVLDYVQAGVDAILRKAAQAGLGQRITAAQHDVRRPLPSDDAAFDACYSHMLFCMALRTSELAALSRQIFRVLRPGGLCIYTVRKTNDPDFGRGIHRGEGLYENQGLIVHFFDRAKVEELARGWELVSIDEFEEAKLPRRLYRVTLQKPATG